MPPFGGVGAAFGGSRGSVIVGAGVREAGGPAIARGRGKLLT